MRDNDEFNDIPPMTPDRDDVDSYQRNRKQSDIIAPAHDRRATDGERRAGSGLGVQLMLGFLTLAFLAAGGLFYVFYTDYQNSLVQANRRISDLEGRLALVGDSTEETTANVIERLDFNFSEIDKLWAARNATNSDVNELSGQLSRLETANQAQDEAMGENSAAIEQNRQAILDAEREINELSSDVEQTQEALARLDSAFENMRSLAAEMEDIQAELNSGDDTIGGLTMRMRNVEEAIEAIDAYRLQLNQTVIRLQEEVEAVQRGTP